MELTLSHVPRSVRVLLELGSLTHCHLLLIDGIIILCLLICIKLCIYPAISPFAAISVKIITPSVLLIDFFSCLSSLCSLKPYANKTRWSFHMSPRAFWPCLERCNTKIPLIFLLEHSHEIIFTYQTWRWLGFTFALCRLGTSQGLCNCNRACSCSH